MENKIYNRINELEGVRTRALSFFALLRCNQVIPDKYYINVAETYRTQQRQNELYDQGRTKPGKVVTWTLKSEHTKRRALDIYLCKNSEIVNDAKLQKKIDSIFKKYGFENGSSWKNTPETPHHQLNEEPSKSVVIKAFFTVLANYYPNLKKEYHWVNNGKWSRSKQKAWTALCRSYLGVTSTRFQTEKAVKIMSKIEPKLYVKYW